jgi:diguanylate cyclase (GGDEF)-like protein
VYVKQACENLRAKRWAFGKKHQWYRDEVITYQLDAQSSFSKHNALIFFLLGFVFLLLDNLLWKTFRLGTAMCFAVGAFSTIYYFLCKKVLPKHRDLVIAAGNIYIFIMGKSLLTINLRGNGDVSWTLLLCALISTSILVIVPYYYAVDILLIIVFDLIEYGFTNNSPVYILYNFLDDFIIGAFCIGINVIFSRMKYAELERKESLYSESTRDALTGIFNRRYLESYFASHAEKDARCAFLMLDLDNFKMANDVFGHKTGDKVLCEVADILKTNFRENDCVARLGGDEYAVFLPDVTQTEVVTDRVEQVLNCFPIIIEEGKRVEVSVSIGVVFKEAGSVPAYTHMCDMADGAMYRAKKAGKAQAVIATAGMPEDIKTKETNHENTVYERYQYQQKA